MSKLVNHIGIGVEDVSDVLEQIEKKFNLKFSDNELQHVKTFGDLSDIILSKINLPNEDSCSSQQAFYKFRTAFLENATFNRQDIKPDTKLKEMFTNLGLKKTIKSIEVNLGFKLNILKVKRSVMLFLFIGLTCSLFTIFINLIFCICFASITLVFYFLMANTLKEFKVNTVGEVVEIMLQNNYFKSRRHQSTINREEFIQLLKKYFLNNLATELNEINMDTIII